MRSVAYAANRRVRMRARGCVSAGNLSGYVGLSLPSEYGERIADAMLKELPR